MKKDNYLKNGEYKVFQNYHNKDEFIDKALDVTFDGISKITNQKVANLVRKNGLKKLHLYFNPDYLPFLQFFLSKRFDLNLRSQIYYTSSYNLDLKKFYIDAKTNYRIIYPYLHARKSTLSRAQYLLLNLNNFDNVDKEIQDSKKKLVENLSKNKNKGYDSYFKNLPISCYGHGPHRDTWFGHTYNANNFWWSITGVNKKSGLLIFPDVNKQDIRHIEKPAYARENQYLGKPEVIGLNDGDLLVFDPEILHATRINTSNDSRVVFSGRINRNKPSFYKESKAQEYKEWFYSEDIKCQKLNKIHIFLRKNNSSKKKKKVSLKPTKNFETILINKKLVRKSNFRIIKKSQIKKDKLYQLKFRNMTLGMKMIQGKLKIFQATCPHLSISLLDGFSKNEKIICPGHGLTFNLLNGKSDCSKLNLKIYEISEEKDFIFLNA